MNRARLRSRYAYRPVVRYDVFPVAEPVGKARVVGEMETFEQLPLPETAAAQTLQSVLKSSARGRQDMREIVYVPWEESA